MALLKKLNIYIAKSFLIKFLQISVSFSLLIFLINFIDVQEKLRDSELSSLRIELLMASLQIPSFINEIVSSLVMISAIITFFLLSSKSEITIMRSSGYSLWQVLQPVATSAFLLGIFWIAVLGPVSVEMTKKFNQLEAKYVLKERREMVVPSNGIWLKQDNIQKPKEEIIIRAKKSIKDSLEFKSVTLWFFDKNGKFYEKIDSQEMSYQDGIWILKNVVVNNKNEINKKLKSYSIKTNLESEFIRQTIINNFQNEKLFSIYELPNLIETLQASGFASTKFKVYFNSLLSKPLLFVAMTLIACFFGINHTRNNKSVIMIFSGIALGLIFYITSGIITALGASGLIPVFASTWIITIICLAIGTLLIYQKEKF